jgi:hypothetical protein
MTNLKDSVVLEMSKKAIQRSILMEANFVVNPGIETRRLHRVAKVVADSWREELSERGLKVDID